MKQTLFSLFLFIFFPLLNVAQPFVFRHLNTGNGLLSDLRLCIAEDRIGRVWIGSEEGINVFDGYQLSSYSKPDHSGLEDNNIRRMFCDRQGTIWVATPSGVQYKMENTSKFMTLKSDSLKFTDVWEFGETTRGDLIIVDAGIVYRVHKQKHFTKLSGLSAMTKKYKYLTCLEKFRNDEWFFGFNGKLILADLQTDRIVKEYEFRNAWCVSKVSDSLVIAGSFVKDSVVLINTLSGKTTWINDWPADDGKKMSAYAANIYPIGNNRFAIGCRYAGIYIADLNQRKLSHIVHDASEAGSVGSNLVRRLYVTRSGFMFVHATGISYTPVISPQFKSLLYLMNAEGEKYDGGATSFARDKTGNIWVSTNKHLAYWDRQTGVSRFFPYYTTEGAVQKMKTVRAVVTDRADNVWVGTFGGGLGMLKPDGHFQQFKHDKKDPHHTLPGNEIHAIIPDARQHFMICCNFGFAYFNPLSREMKTFYNDSALKRISKNHTYCIIADSMNNWWIGQYDGLFFYDRKRDTLHEIKFPAAVNDKIINCLSLDHKGSLYAGGKSGMFIIPHKTLEISKWISKKNGMTSNIVNGIVCDKNGIVWMASNIGLAAYDPLSEKLEVFNASDGIIPSNHSIGCMFQHTDGEILLASLGGINYFHPDSIKSERKPLQVFVTSLELNDSTIENPQLRQVHFSHNSNNFSFSYLVVDFNPASSIQYRYKLLGFDTSWVNAGKQRTARYTNLEAGKYSFVVEASANGRDWFASTQQLDFSIEKAFWTTWWFRSSLFVIVLLLIYLYYQSRITIINKEARLRSDYEIKLNELENSALRTQMNPHFIFNSLNTINSFINRNEPAKANQYISKFAKLIRLILDHSRQKKISLAEEIEVLELYIQLERIRFDNKFHYRVLVSDNIDTDTTEVPPMVLQPFVENSILHGLLPLPEGGRLSVSIQRSADVLLCFVEDNGIGRQQATQNKTLNVDKRKSHGMDITLKRIELFNAEHGLHRSVLITDLKDEAGQACGTKVEIPVAWVESF